MDFSLDKKYELKSRLATTEACLHVLEHKMKEASCFHENTLTSMKNEWGRKINSLQAAYICIRVNTNVIACTDQILSPRGYEIAVRILLY